MGYDTLDSQPVSAVLSAMPVRRRTSGHVAPRYEHDASPGKISQWIVLPTAAALSVAGWILAVYAFKLAAGLIPHL
jgi:hypothetical protein